MNQTNQNNKELKNFSQTKLTVNIQELSAILSCGNMTARKIAESAEARVIIGRRVLYFLPKIMKYLNNISI